MAPSIRSTSPARPLRLVAATLVAGLLTVFPAGAAHAGDDEAATRKARKHYEKADLEYRLGHFDDALVEYGRAYGEKRLPAFLFNIAQCHKMLGNREKAIFFYESFLRDAPDTPKRALVESLLAESRGVLEERARDELKRAAAEAALGAPVPSAVAPRPVLRRAWLWTIVAVVAVGGATAAVVALAVPHGTVLPSGSLGTLDGRD